jgi:phosphatidylglycerophosphatase C
VTTGPANIDTVVIFDLDRTITTAGTYTPFLLSCAPWTPLTLLRMLAAIAAMAAYVLKLTTRGKLKARMLAFFIAGASRVQVMAWAATFVSHWLREHVRPGALAAVERHRAAGHRLVLVTASFDFYAQVFGDRLGFHHVIGTASVWDKEGRLCAALGGENCYGPVKFEMVKVHIAKKGARPRIVAYTDHHSDFDLLRWADEGVAVNPNAKLRRLAEANKLKIEDWT